MHFPVYSHFTFTALMHNIHWAFITHSLIEWQQNNNLSLSVGRELIVDQVGKAMGPGICLHWWDSGGEYQQRQVPMCTHL